MGAPLTTTPWAVPQGRRKSTLQVFCFAALAWTGSGAVVRVHADDRPFLRTTHAMAADDDDGWEVSSTLVANRKGQALSLQIEHELSPTQRFEVEFGGSTREQAPEPEQGLRLRSLWVSSDEHGWGLATKVGVELRRNNAERGDRWQALSVVSLPLLQGRWWLHANIGWQWQRSSVHTASRTTLSSVATHFVLNPEQWLYAETAMAADGSDRLIHMGWRQWLKPHKWALDVGGGRQRAAEHPGEFIAINLSFFDLNF